ncbi:MAG: DUF87 domain-containing protein [Acidimicrobiia bacterium]
MIDVPSGHLYLGERVDPAAHERTGEPVLLKAADLTTHGVIVGMTGSGKTGLGVVMLEEALLAGVPTLILDPKGDLGNLLLTFPALDAASFAPWVEGGDGAGAADSWRSGLEGWGIGPERIQALRDAAEFTVYTPGSSSGVALDVVGALRRPGEGTGAEVVADEVEGFVSGLLGLVGIDADPLASREHILLSNLVASAWAAGRDLDLATLVGQVQTPPLRKLGVFELDAFFPPDERTKLAVRLNGLLASPSFAAWTQGVPVDLDALLRPGDRPGCAIVSLAHLSDQERQFVVTLVLSKLVTWMRRQPGTDRLRALVYFDEVMGYVPPNGAPPAKKPILTLLKQARAFGVGVVLATQNPVDVDYKAISNAGTWMVGRLQTEQDKARLIDGLKAASGGVDVGAVSTTISGLAKREFVLKQAGSDQPSVFTTRWAMSYLRGPLTSAQISTLMAGRTGAAGAPAPSAAGTAPATADPTGAAAGAAATVATPAGPSDADPAPAAAAPSGGEAPAAGAPEPTVVDPGAAASAPGAPAASAAPAAPATPVAPATPAAPAPPAAAPPAAPPPAPAAVPDDASPVAPSVADGVPVRWLHPAATWAAQVGVDPASRYLVAGVAATVDLLFDDTAADLRHTERYEAVLVPLGPSSDVERLVPVDHDPRDFTDAPPEGATYALAPSEARISTKAYFNELGKAVVEHLVRSRTVVIRHNPELKLYGRPGEADEEFAARCEAAADDGADAATAKLTKKYAARIDRARDALAAAQDRVEQARTAQTSRRSDELVSGAGELLGAILGGRRSARSIATGIGSAMRRRGRAGEASKRVEVASNRAEEKATALADLEADLADELAAIAAEWDAKAAAVQDLEVPLERSDVKVAELALVWFPRPAPA